MNRNIAYLMSLWIPVILLVLIFGGWVLFLGVSLAQRREIQPAVVFATLVIGSLGFTFGFVRFLRGYQARKIERLLQSASPDALVNDYRKTIKPGLIPNGDALLAHGCACAYLLYGEFGKARAELESVDWADRPPLIVSHRRMAEALLCYLETREYEMGLAIAKSAQQLADVPSGFPGAQKSSIAFESIVLIGEILVGRARPSTVADLDANFDVLPVTAKLLIAWALVQAHEHCDSDKRREMNEFIRRVGPNCRALAFPETRSAN